MTELLWKKIKVDPRELSINKVLRCGQAFRWKQINNTWSCSLYNRVIFLRQDHEFLHYASLFSKSTRAPKLDDTELMIKDYFQLQINLLELYNEWSKSDKNFLKMSTTDFKGIRMLRQDPWENLISFICSQNNNVKRISKMCDTLCENYGTYLLSHDEIDYYAFPQPEQLHKPGGVLEQELRQLGFGYRAKYLEKTTQMIYESKIDLLKLRSQSYEDCFNTLIEFQGVGPKVADCVCLMSLDKTDIVPVDTHVFTFAKRDYKFKTPTKTLNRQLYEEIRFFFKKLWGNYAGWAHSVLFAADLKDLNNGINLIRTTTTTTTTIANTPSVKIEEKSAVVQVKTEQDKLLLSLT